MLKLWILVANRSGAKLLEYRGRTSGVRMIKSFENPLGRLKSREIHSPHHDSHDTALHSFARRLASELDLARNHRLYEDVAIVAEPRVLGAIRTALTSETEKRIVRTLPKDLADLSDRELSEHLRQVTEDYDPLVARVV